MLFKRRARRKLTDPTHAAAFMGLVARFTLLQQRRFECVNAVNATASALPPDTQAALAGDLRELLHEILRFDRAAWPWNGKPSEKPLAELERSLDEMGALWPEIEARIDRLLVRMSAVEHGERV